MKSNDCFIKKVALLAVCCAALVGCSPPEPPQLQATGEVLMGRSFPVVSERWQAIQGNIEPGSQWAYEWLVYGAAAQPVDNERKTEFFYLAQHADKVFILNKDAQTRFRMIEYLSRNGVSPAIIHEVADDSLDTFISIWFVKEGEQK